MTQKFTGTLSTPRPQFANAESLADWLETLHECYPDGAVGNRKWEAAQVAAKAIRATLSQPADSGRVVDGVMTALAVIYGSGYRHGHEATVEGGYTDVVHYDRETYWLDTVREMVDEDADLAAALAAQGQGEAVAWRIDTDDDVERVAKAVGWDNRRYMTPADYAIWCSRMREFVRLAAGHAAPPASPAGVPDGMVLVPWEPTPVMLAIYEHIRSGSAWQAPVFRLTKRQLNRHRAAYKAMIAVAPSAPTENAGVPDGVERCMHGCYCGGCQACKNGSCEPVKYTACDCIAAAPSAPEGDGGGE